ncbi:MAG: DUF3311 domain-containing protein [Verrucomicrobiota bacterium]
MKKAFVYILILMMFLLHQDFWLWDDKTLIFGFIPVGLFYHTLFSIFSSGLWFLAIYWAWPLREEEDTEDSEANS